MPNPTVPLSALAEQLARKQSELEQLRQSYESRLAEPPHRKEELEASLRQVDAEIQVAAQGPALSPAAPAAPVGNLSLPKAVLAIVQEKREPLTIAQLVEELRRRRFPTSSGNLSKMVSNRVHDLIGKKVLAR